MKPLLFLYIVYVSFLTPAKYETVYSFMLHPYFYLQQS